MNNKGINRKVTIMEVFMEGVKLNNIMKKPMIQQLYILLENQKNKMIMELLIPFCKSYYPNVSNNLIKIYLTSTIQ